MSEANGLKSLSYHRQLIDLLLMQLSNFRWSWSPLILTGCLTPLVAMVGLSVFARSGMPSSLPWIYCGNLVISLLFGNLNNVAANFAFMRLQGSLEYFALLPIRRSLLIVATILAFFLLSLPGLLITMLVGAAILDVSLVLNPGIVLLIPLCVLPIAGLGALIGTLARSPEQSSAISLGLTVLMTAVGPVVVPPALLPAPLAAAGFLNPATYAASALRQALLGDFTTRLLLDVGVLMAVTLVIFGVLANKLHWTKAQ